MPDSHKKKTAKEAISNEQESKGKYSPQELRKHMSTGGGEPIAKGNKWTSEHRVLQPRDPDTGHFTYNADAQLGLKYPQRGKGAIPVGAKGWILNDGIKKGDKVVTDDSIWIAIDTIDKQKLIDYFKKYDETEGEYYLEDKSGKSTGLSSEFVGKRGRKSKDEKTAIENAKSEKEKIAEGYYDSETASDTWRIVDNVDISSLGKYSKEEIKKKFEEKAKGFDTNKQLSQFAAEIGIEKKAKNEAYNAYNKSMAESKKDMEKESQSPNVAGAGEATEQETKETMQETKTQETYKPSTKNIVANPKKEYEDHKEYWDKKVEEYNQKNGTSHSAAWLVQALAKKYGGK